MNRKRMFTMTELILIVLLLVIVAALMGQLLVTVFTETRAKNRRVNCASHLKQIGTAVLMYSADHAGYFPNLYPNGGTSWCPVGSLGYLAPASKDWACPSARIQKPCETWSSYRYIGSGLKDEAPNATLVSLGYDLSANHPDNQWMNVSFADGHVEGARPGTKPGFNND